MTDQAFQKQYRQEMIAGFETRQSLLRETVTTEIVVKGNQAEFLVRSRNGAAAVTRGVNGNIPTRTIDSTQTTVTLVEWHDIPELTGFNIFASQGNQRSRLQEESMEVINTKIDSDIITELNTGTVNTGGATTASHPLVTKAKTILQNAKVPWDRRITGLITPAFNGYLEQIDAFNSADYVDLKPLVTGGNAWQDKPIVRHWMGVNWIVHPDLPGVGTSAAKCFMYHQTAIGHAVNTGGLMTVVGYEDKQDRSFARCSIYMGTQILQNSGVVVMNHDDSAYVAA